MTILSTPRLLLRQMTEDDAENIYQLNSDPEVLKYVHELPLVSIEAARQTIIDKILPQYPNKLGRWAIILKADNSFLGWCGLKYRADTDDIDLGYRLHKFAWGKGYATEAAAHTLAYGLDVLELPVIVARAHVDNLASQHVLEKIGMKYWKDDEVDSCPVRVYVAG